MRWLLLATLVAFAAGASGCDPGVLPGPPAEESSSTAADTGFPCDVRAVLEARCARCHTAEIYASQFFTREDLLATWGGGVTLGQIAAMRVQKGEMPPPAVSDIDDAERTLLIAWVAAGMPPGPCGPLTPPPSP